MSTYYGDIKLGDTIDFRFTSRRFSTGAPFTLAGSPTLAAYVGNSTTEITAGITLSVDFDSRTGLNNVRVVASAANGYTTATNVDIVITAGTVDSVSVVGEVVGSFSIGNRRQASIRSGTAQAGSATTITLDAGASATDGLYDPAGVLIVSGTGEGQFRLILDYVGSTKVATVDRAWRTNPDNTSVFQIIAMNNLVSTNEGSAQAGAANTITLNALASATNDTYVGQTVVIRAGTGSDQARVVTAYNGGTKVATVDRNWVTNPAAGSVYMMFPEGAAYVASYATGQAPLQPTVAGRTLVVSGAGEADANVTRAAGTAWNSGAITNNAFASETGLRNVRNATAQAGGATTITLDASASAVTDFYKNDLIILHGIGTGFGQARFITAYDGATKVATVDSSWAVNPDNTSTFAIRPWSAVPGATAPTAAQVATAVWQDLTAGSDFTTANSIGKLLVDNVNATISSRMASYTQPTGFLAATFPATVASTTNITAGTITTATNVTTVNGLAANVITAASTAADYVTEMSTMVGSALTSYGASTLTQANIRTAVGLASANLDTQLDALPTATENATALLDTANGIETGLTPRQSLRLISAATAGKASGAATATITYRNAVADTDNRIVATVDADGNRTAITYDLT